MTPQITMRELLRNPIFREWMRKPPKLGRINTDHPWRLYVQSEQDGPWAKKDVQTYARAYRYLVSHLKQYHDMAIVSKVLRFQPPVVKDSRLGRKRYYYFPYSHHEWCPYCRRPTIFRAFFKHHAFGNRVIGWQARCTICGIRQTALRRHGARR